MTPFQQNEYNAQHDPAYGQSPPELVCRCPSCAASLSIAAENAENIKVQCMVCGTIFSPLSPLGTETPPPPYREPAGYDRSGYDYPPESYSAPSPYPPQPNGGYADPYRPNMNHGGYQADPYSEFNPVAYPPQAAQPSYPDMPYAPQPDPYMESAYPPYQPGHADVSYYNGAPNYPAAPPPYPDAQPYGYAPYAAQPHVFEQSELPPFPPQTGAPPTIQQLPVRESSVPSPPQNQIPSPPAQPLPDSATVLKEADPITQEALTGTNVPVKEILGDGNSSPAFKLVKSEYDYYMKDDEPQIKKKGSFFKIFFFMFLPLVAIGWSVWGIYSRQNLILYAVVALVCFVVFILALVAYNRTCPHCGRWSSLIKEKKQDQYGKYNQLQCKHCDFTLDVER